MVKKMLIDACHPEETRVAVLEGTRVDDFDFETQSKKQLRGNIYLAKVTRVEPSLQAAFVDFGGNRHGFLAFGEIHPDYYQIPMADREALKAEFEALSRSSRKTKQEDEEVDDGEPASEEPLSESDEEEIVSHVEEVEESDDGDDGDDDHDDADSEVSAELVEAHAESSEDDSAPAAAETAAVARVAEEDDDDDDDDDEADAERRRRLLTRRYKIQEVIRRRQIMLVQVVKEERGNKGAALTTYLSLAGRYCVLMPNSGRGGGISRKISAGADRKRLKKIANELEVPNGMGLIVRTAGAKRTKTEIKRDYEYLIRAWETIRDTTMRSVAPAQIYEESSLVKRAIRDLYDKDVEEIYVEGNDAYREAKDFIRMLMPSHAKKVHHYTEPTPIFAAHGIERQLETVFDPVVHLKSGGYIVINQTEALVAIDVNSGRATRERGIEQTAVKTNLEAADEVARQMRMRDLAGLIVIDFIDMEESKNDRAVEKRMKDALRFDRARIQMGKISSFGLMELSRQRRRTSVLEGSSHVCEHCAGSGRVRSIESSALRLLRALDDEAQRHHAEILEARAPSEVALYLLNEKRDALSRIEDSRGVKLRVVGAPNLLPPHFELSSVGVHHPVEHAPRVARAEIVEDDDDDYVVEAEDEDEDEADEEDRAPASANASEDGNGRSRRRRRGRRGGRRREGEERAVETKSFDGEQPEVAEDEPALGEAEAEGDEAGAPAAGANGNGDERRRRRRRRRGRGRRGERGDAPNGEAIGEAESDAEDDADEDDDTIAASSESAAEQTASEMEAPAYVAPTPAPAPEPVAPVVETRQPDPAPQPQPEPEPAMAESAPARELTSEVDYSPDQERREKFLARLSRWGRK
jgi:ribonuclease E